MPSTQPLTAQRVMNFLAKHDLKWYIDCEDEVRTKIKKQCYCALTAYVYLNHNLYVEEGDAADFAAAYLNMEEDQANLLITGADNTIEQISDDYDPQTAPEMYKGATKIRRTLEGWAQAAA